MTLAELTALVGGRCVTDPSVAPEVSCAYSSDLLSDVMGHAPENSVLVTIQNHLNTIAVCTLAGIEIIVLCHDRPAPADMVAAANREGVAIVVTSLSQYAASLALSSLPPGSR